MLLVLDNCEHLIAACAALVGALLRAAPRLRVLATSREGLEVGGEHSYRVPSLPIPDLAHLPPAERLAESAAVALFVARATARRRDFALDERTGSAVAAVCARLDGIPLAIELAAAWVGSLPVDRIAARLDQSMQLLTGGSRDALPRQQTLRATLDWSWDLLGESERALLRRLSVFVGGWTLEAAEAICAGERVETEEVVDLLGGLVNKSLVQAQEGGEEARYRLLEPVRQYAAERLLDAGEYAVLSERHLDWCLSLAEEAGPQLCGPDFGAWLARLEAEHDNVRTALRRSMAGNGAAVKGLQLAGVLFPFWVVHGYLSEGRRWLEEMLALGDTRGAPPAVLARAQTAAGALAGRQGDHAQASALLGKSLALSRELGDKRDIAAALNSLGGMAWMKSDYGSAVVLWEESLALARELGDRLDIAWSLNHLGLVAMNRGDYAQAWTLQEEALILARELGDKLVVATSLRHQGLVATYRGDYAQASLLHQEGLALAREMGDKLGIAWSLGHLGLVACRQGNYTQAWAQQEESLALARELGHKQGIADSLNSLGVVAYLRGDLGLSSALFKESLLLSHDIRAGDLMAKGLEALAWVAVACSQPRRAASLGAAAELMREEIGVALTPDYQTSSNRAVQAMRAALGEEAFVGAWADGRALSLEAAIAEALAGSKTD